LSLHEKLNQEKLHDITNSTVSNGLENSNFLVSENDILSTEHFRLIVNTDLYVNKSSKSAIRNQYRSLLSFQEIFKIGKKQSLHNAYLHLGCSQAHWYTTLKRCRPGSLST
jgi:hypothetical protein